ncbi:MAG: glycoside hydrolase family 71/99-like protein [Opitutales bacterium]
MLAICSLLASSTPSILAKQEDLLVPYEGPTLRNAVDRSTLYGKVMTGYQGWFNTEGDGAGLGWTHWAKNRRRPLAPDNAGIDFWPDVSDFEDNELYETGFKESDGSPAKVFSSHDRKTVLRHFQWMQEYGIDGAFIQRFIHSIHRPESKYHKDKVLSSAREGANCYGRAYAVMYDLTGLPDERIEVVIDDFRTLYLEMQITKDPAYLHHNGKPLVAIWGVGFNENSKERNSFESCRYLVERFKNAGFSVMLGVPTGWREMERDSIDHPELHDMLRMADVISPWSVTRFRDLQGLERHTENHYAPDLKWCREHSLDYLPVIFPGFSWYNNKGGDFDAIPRLKGKFLWSQAVANKRAGANMLYIAMFDEVDEGTAIFKLRDTPPIGEPAKFVGLEGLPSDFYLRLAGNIGKMLRDEIPVSDSVPVYK